MLDKTDVNRSLKLALTKTLNPEVCPDSPYMGLNTDRATGSERVRVHTVHVLDCVLTYNKLLYVCVCVCVLVHGSK